MPWQDEAACYRAPPEIFFPEFEKGRSIARTIRAKRFCLECPVQVDCLHYAIENEIEDGIYGGMTYDERSDYARSTLDSEVLVHGPESGAVEGPDNPEIG